MLLKFDELKELPANVTEHAYNDNRIIPSLISRSKHVSKISMERDRYCSPMSFKFKPFSYFCG